MTVKNARAKVPMLSVICGSLSAAKRILLQTLFGRTGDKAVDRFLFLARGSAICALIHEELVKLGEQKLQPGMLATVFVRTGDRTPFDYLVKPITDSMSLAWREQ